MSFHEVAIGTESTERTKRLLVFLFMLPFFTVAIKVINPNEEKNGISGMSRCGSLLVILLDMKRKGVISVALRKIFFHQFRT